MWGNIAIAFLLAFIVSFMVTPYSIKLAVKVGAIDIPKDDRRMRKKAIPKLGGVAVILGFVVAVIYLVAVMHIEGTLNLFDENMYFKKIIGIGLGIIVISITGIIDDIKTIKPLQKLFGQVLAAVIVVAFGVQINNIDIPYFSNLGLSTEVSVIATIIWIVAITNAINLIDGLDGLSSGIALISCISLLIIFALNNSPMIAIIMITSLVGALVGFLPFNFSPAKTFIGDTGSNFLGYILSIVSILGVAKTYTAVVIALPLVVLGLPIFDVTWAIIRRIIKGKSIKAIFQADKGHLHHRLVAKGFSQKQAVLILYAVSAALGLFAIIILESGIWKALSFLLMVIAALFLGYRNFINENNEKGEKYECGVCKYIYNPKTGNEKAGIAPGTEFEDLPEDWVCPVCGEGKDVFEIHK
jgi:UDP-GlcNAc:undecaprenyl-phosphate GlcNAc-1-phosphate transferase